MAKQLNVNLAFTADTSKARSQLQELQNQLSKLTSAPAQSLNLKWTQEIQEATTAAMELKTHLQNATNVQTGTLDFTKLNSSIKSSGKNLSEYARQLQSLGTSGQQAFMQLAGAVSQAEIPIRRSNATLKEMMTTLKNTARWQLSSSMLHGFMGAVQSAYGYAQDLNASLNNIRIVTGQTTDQMAKFAEQANKAAKALSTNTTDYTNASLIYYQQGLTDDEVAKRTAVTVKMANAAGQSAQIVSDQLTSVWNNFYDGSKSLEYYADVMTALGAATASSTDEIAGGLEKFAAVADTIGLSYEYAASALATITSNTRQSEEVVGTALKTIFARIQGLNLGETLEDGTTLNKYSEALQKIGISIFESSGEIKKMDDILDEMASKWQTLAKDQQIALAQTVAGVRQYNQLVSLMDNWNAGDADSMAANLKTAYGASGELQKQADIYAESWEAAQDRVRAASEGIFQSLIDEDFFIGVLNSLEKILTYVDNTIDSLGGLKGVLSTVGVLMTKVFSEQMAQGLRNMAHNVYMSTEGGRQAAKQAKYDALDDMQRQMSLGYDGIGSISGEAASQQYAQQIEMQKELIANSERMSQSEIANAQQLLDLRRQIGDQVIKAAEAEEKAKDRLADSKQKAYREMGESKGEAGVSIDDIDKFDALSKSMDKIVTKSQSLEGAFNNVVSTIDAGGEVSESAMQELSQAIKNVGTELNLSEDDITNYLQAFKQGGEEAAKAYEKLMGLLNAKQGRNQASMQALGVDKKTTQDIVDNYGQIRNAIDKKAEAERRAKLAQEEYKKSLQSAKGVVKDWANSLVSSAQGVMSLISIVNALSGAIDTLTNPDISGWEKFISVLQSGAMIMMMTVSMMNSFAQAKKNWEKGTLSNAAATLIDAAAESVLVAAKKKTAGASAKKSIAMDKDTVDTLENAGANMVDATSENVNANSKKKTAGEVKKLGAAFKKLGGAAKEWIAANGSMLASAGMIAAAAAIVVGVIASAVNQYNAQTKAAEEAASAAEKVAEAYNNVKSNYEAISSTADAYKSTIESMEEMTKNTNEYNNALMQANDSAMELIKHYKELKYDIEEGLIVIDEKSLAEAQKKELAKVSRQQANTILANSEARYRANEVNKTKFKRDLNTKSDDDKAVGNAAMAGIGGAATAALVTAALMSNPVGWIVGAVTAGVGLASAAIGGLVTEFGTGAQSEEEDAAINAIAQYVKDNGNSMFKDEATFKSVLKDKIKIDDTNLIDALWLNNEALQELTAVEVAKLTQEQADWQAAFSLYNQGNEKYTNFENQDYLNNRAYSDSVNEETKNNIVSQVESLWSGSNDDFWDAYLTEVLGEKNATGGVGENYQIVDKGGGAVTLQQKTDKGTWETIGDKDSLDEDFAQQQLVDARIMQEASKNINDYILDFATLAEDLNVAGAENETLVNKILSDFSAGKPIDLSEFAPEVVSQIVGNAIADPDLREAVNSAVETYNENIPSWWDQLTPEEKSLAWSMDFDDDATLEEVQNACARMQAYLDSNTLIGKIKIASEMQAALESGNWDELKTLFLNNGFSQEDWIEFLKLGSLDKMSGFINRWESGMLDDATRMNQKAIDQAVNDYEAAQEEKTEAATEFHEAEAERTRRQGELQEAQARSNIANDNYDAVHVESYMGDPRYIEDWDTYYTDWTVSGLTEFFKNYANADLGQSEDEVLLASTVTEFLEVSQAFQDWMHTYGDNRKNFSYTSSSGMEYTNDNIAIEWDQLKNALGGYLSGYTDIYGNLVVKNIDQDSEQYKMWDSLIGSQGTLTELPRTMTEDSDSRDLYNAVLPFLTSLQGLIDATEAEKTSADSELSTAELNYAEYDSSADSKYTAASNRLQTANNNLDGTKEGNAADNYEEALKDQTYLRQKRVEEIESLGLDLDVYEEMKKSLVSVNDELEGQEDFLHNLAKAQLRAERGMKKMGDSQEDWKKIIESSDETSSEYLETIVDMRDAYADVFNLDFDTAEQLDAEFLTRNMDLMTEALKGSQEAFDQLQANVSFELIKQKFGELPGITQEALNEIASQKIEAGDIIDIENNDIAVQLSSMYDTAIRAAIDGGATVAEAMSYANDLMNAVGFEAPEIEFVEKEIYVTGEIPSGYEPSIGGTFTDSEGVVHTGVRWSETKSGEYQHAVTMLVPQATKFTKSVEKIGGNTPPPKSGGGGSKPKKAEPTKKSDVVKRYKEVEDKLDDIRDEADRTRSSLDRLYGAEHEAAIQRLLELEQQEIDLLKEKEQEARNYLQEDLKELKKVSAEVDVEFKFDDNNNIENYEEEMTELYEELAEIQRKAGDEWDENEQKEIDALNEKIQKLEEAMAAYEETRELLEDINAELDAFKGKPALPLITSDTLDIYWEINDALDDIDEKIKDLERKAEGLSGEEKLKVLEEINRLEEERVAILQQQAEANQKDIEEKRAALDKLAELNGLQFEYDEETGNITNYLEQMGILQAQLDELHAKKAADGLSPAEEEAMNSIIAKMQELADLAGDYRDAVEESEDILNEIEDTLSGVVADPFVRSDFVDIFKETNDQLDDIDRKISKLQNEADKLTGEARRKKLNEIVTLERKRVEILEHQALIAKTEMEDRKRAMEEIAARRELMFEYDENQNITNYQEQLDVLIDKYEKAYNEALGDDGLIDATEQAILDFISDDIDHLEEFIQAYCDAVDQLEDIEDEREELANGGYVDMSQLDDIADELHDINQSLDDLQELLDDSARAADRLYGEARIKQMEKNASLLQQEIDLLQQKKTAQDDIIAKEKQQLDEKTGGYIKYDEYGRITNYDSYINAREDQIREYEAALQEGGLSETEATLLQDEIDLLNEQIAAMEDYEQALEEKEDIQNQIEDAYYEWQDLNAEKLQYKLELQLDVNDRELAKIERAIKRLDGNFYSRAEALALMVGGGMNGDSKLGNYNKQLADLEAHYQEVKRQYEAGEISQAKYVEMTKGLQAEIESTADAMAALQDQMDSYYKDTLAQARQELNFHISQLTHLTGILNHFKNTLTALGKSKDYEMMGTVLEGQVQALENEVKASKNAMQMWQKEADSIYQKYQQALSSGNQENADMYYNAYKEALSAANEAENKFYQQSAAWANALKALMENTLAGLAQDLENALTGGTSFDTITTQMKRASSLQEEYLTTTNKIYETTKLMRTAQQEIDKTTNSVAKRKLSQFITETKQMQNQNKLSKYELSIQQAKYDLLVAEIALEEARFAKSTVRLRRDSEGNFGYVYTADAQAIATAEQKFEDAQNKLYNIGLDGANKYTEKYQQTLAEMYNTLTSLQTKYLQGGFESEAEYNAAVLEAKEYYYEKLNQYSELYSVAINAESGTLTDTLVNNSGIVTDALTKNSRIAADAWSTDFADMTTKTDQWMVAVTDYLSQVQNAFADWEVESQRIANETVGTDLTTLKNKVSDIVTESDNLTAAIGDENSGVIKAIYDEITAVSGLVAEYSNLNGQLTQAIQNAYDLSDALQQDIDQAGQDENPPGQYAPGEEESQKPGTVVPEGTDPLPEIELPEDPDENNSTNPGETTPTEPGETTPTEPGETTPEGTTECTHAETTTQEVAPKCEKGGYKKVLCDSCNKMLENVTYPALGHDYKEGKCTRCGKKDPNWKESKDVLNNKVEGVAAAIWMDGSDVSGWGTGNTRKNRLKEKGVSKAQDYINKHAENGDIYAAWHNKRSQLKQYYYGKFDTGGYTGAWGPEGKWAMLHEKEIVLNKEDTKNFLASLELLDNILSTIDLHAMNSQWASNLISPDVSSIGKEALEQMVNIEASFPNATDKHEIEEAFKDLVNLASQYANRK